MKLITYLDAAYNLVAVADSHLTRHFANHPSLSELYRDVCIKIGHRSYIG